jgi:hypothetical protein
LSIRRFIQIECPRPKASRFAALSDSDIANYRAELETGAAALSRLMQKDLAGQLPDTGKSMNFGSLYIIGSKIGGMGIYTKPEDVHFHAQLIEETDKYVVVRLAGRMHNTLMGGGLAFGVHQADRSLVQTLTPAN